MKPITFCGIIVCICLDLCGYLHDTELRLWKTNFTRTKKRDYRQESVYSSRIIQSKRGFPSNKSTKFIRKHTNACSEFLLFLLADTLRESIFAGINLTFNKTWSPQIDKNNKNIFVTFIYNSIIDLLILFGSILGTEIR